MLARTCWYGACVYEATIIEWHNQGVNHSAMEIGDYIYLDHDAASNYFPQANYALAGMWIVPRKKFLKASATWHWDLHVRDYSTIDRPAKVVWSRGS